MKSTHMTHEPLSALADGQLQGKDFDDAMARLAADDELRSVWRAYHVVGDVLRSGSHVACSDNTVFLAKFQQRLLAEAVAPTTHAMPMEPKISDPLRLEAANEPIFRWKLVAGAATIAAVAAISWNWVGSFGHEPAVQLAQQLAPPVLSAAPSNAAEASSVQRVVNGSGNPHSMIRDPRLDRLLEAHREAGGASQMPSGFLRNATFEGSSR